jgi:SAM-dependent methyltransferase
VSKYNPEYIAQYFDEEGDKEWSRLIASPTDEIKLFIHDHYLREYLPTGSRVLEIGAGPGRFTQTLSEIGCQITVSDISQVQLDLNKDRASDLGFSDSIEEWVRLDICDLSNFADCSFDAVVAYGGPLSYVFDQREQAVRECIRVLRSPGLFFVSVMSLWGSMHAFLPGVLDTPSAINRKIIETGDLTDETNPDARNRCHVFGACELRELLLKFGLEISAISASNALSAVWGVELDAIRNDSERWSELKSLELLTSSKEACLDFGTHILAVARRS